MGGFLDILEEDIKKRSMILDGQLDEESQKAIFDFLDEAEIFNMPREKDPSLFELNGVRMICRKALTTVSGKVKQGKSNLIGVLMAAAISKSGKVLDGSVKVLDKGLKVLYVDTEQPVWDVWKPLGRTLRTAGFSKEIDWRELGLYTLHIKNTKKIKTKLGNICQDVMQLKKILIEQAIKRYRADIVIVDNYNHLLQSINDEEKSIELREWIEGVAEDNGCAIIRVMHQNFGSDKTGGWSGSDAEKSSTDMLKGRRVTDSLGTSYFEFTYIGRSMEMPPLKFRIVGDHWELYDEQQARRNALEAYLVKQDKKKDDLAVLFSELLKDGELKTGKLLIKLYNDKKFHQAITDHYPRISTEKGCEKVINEAAALGIIHDDGASNGNTKTWFLGAAEVNEEHSLDL